MEQEYGVIMPKAMHTVFGSLVKNAADKAQRELQNSEIYDVFTQHWIGKKSPLTLLDISETHLEGFAIADKEQVVCKGAVEWDGQKYDIEAKGNGPLDAFVSALQKTPAPKFNITSFHEHSIGSGSDTSAIAYVQITKEDGTQVWGVGKSSNVGRAGIKAVVSALNFNE